MKKKVIRLTESDVENLVRKIIKEEGEFEWTDEVPPLDVVGDYVKEKYEYVNVDEVKDGIINIWTDEDDGMGGPIGVSIKNDMDGYKVGIIHPEGDEDYFVMWEKNVPNTIEGVIEMISEYLGDY